MKKTDLSKNLPKRPTIKTQIKSGDVLVTQAMLFEVRDQLKECIRAEVHGVNSKFHGMDAKFHDVNAKLERIDSKFEIVDAKFEKLTSQIHEVKSEVHRVALLVEEQNARNRIVLDGLTSLFRRQERTEDRVSALERPISPNK